MINGNRGTGGILAPSVRTPADDDTLPQDTSAADYSAHLSERHDEPPAAVPGYAILRRLGDGAYGSVWLAREENTGKQVSIKFYTHRRGLDWSLLNREVEKLAVLYTSRNIVGLLDVGWESEPPYYVMEYLENGSLAGFLADGPLPVHEAVRIAKSVLQALVHAHGSGILHCDLKPANVLLDADFEPRLCDFGQSRLSDEQSPALGTLFYMAPEQADLRAVPDARWDVYALGALLYHMLCGEPPHRVGDVEQQLRAQGGLEERLAAYRRLIRESPRPNRHRKRAGVDKRLADIVDRCLHPDPRKRFPNAQAVLDALQERDRIRSRRPLVALGAVGPALLLFGMAFVFIRSMDAAVDHARGSVIDRALASNVLSAELLANNVQRELEDRLAELVRIANDGELRAAILAAQETGWTERDALENLLDARRQEVDDTRTKLGRRLDTSWFFDDAEGWQRWRVPHDDKTYDQNYAWRDYYHGLGMELDEDTVRFGDMRPIREPHISTAFVSEATRQFMVAISVPVWDAERKNVIGVLARTTHLGELRDEYAGNIRVQEGGDVTRCVAIIDRRDGKLLDHEWMTEDNLRGLPQQRLGELKIPARTMRKLNLGLAEPGNPSPSPPRSHCAVFVDPVGTVDPENYGGRWLAAFAHVGDIGWTAVVQEKRAAALRPVDEMRQDLFQYGLVALAVSCTLIGLLWYFVNRAMTDRKIRLSLSRQSGISGGSGSGSGWDRLSS